MTKEIRTRVAIVGGGPAGMAAARELATVGIDAVIVDEGLRPGGQIFRQLPSNYAGEPDPKYEPPSHLAGHELIHAVAGTRFVGGATVWDIEPDRVHIEREGVGLTVHAERLILATGALDRTLPFPGWTLPGVITAGAAQVMVRGQSIRPGQRAVIAGTGPLLLPTVTSLLSAGAEVVGLFEANRIGGLIRAVPAVIKNRKRRREAWHYAKRLLGAGVRMKTGHAVFAARGEQRLESVAFGRVDSEGHPIPGSECEIEADILCTGFGLLPATELAVRLGCQMHHRELRGGWLPVHDENMATSVAGVFVAGEIAGIGGGDVAIAEGTLAGRSVAAELGVPGDVSSLRARCLAERGATDAMLRAFPVLPGLYDLIQSDTLVCRCEDVTMAEVEQASRACGNDVRSVKLATRAGMGPCQARICHRIIGGILQERLGSSERPTPCHSIQVPIKPVALRTIVKAIR
jgi:NADPH-dependent 2,4-dienoyl-CoA reductase/sulfur reductase-like enzyme